MEGFEIKFVTQAPEEQMKQFAGDMGKYSKMASNYRKPSSAVIDEMTAVCGNCTHYVGPPPNSLDSPSCKIVSGSINPTFTCRFFSRK